MAKRKARTFRVLLKSQDVEEVECEYYSVGTAALSFHNEGKGPGLVAMYAAGEWLFVEELDEP